MLAGTLARDCATAAPGVSLDDQADACGNLREVREALGDREGARRAAEQALSAIEEGSAGAPAATQAIYDWERSQSLLFLGRASEAIALLIERERVLPDSYNPPTIWHASIAPRHSGSSASRRSSVPWRRPMGLVALACSASKPIY